ncbi:hypothetical protein NEUTE1DRAFT_71737 [Neurospora tetrasperma FGSC 2508]|uniref:CAP-Gly domain-containing protein n=1 Tax=Neurospora tetrasperma (strain FGSC 2508 / ATCC MYA-4615 / P0657) TaxID=510951 RepID=F8N1B5_NEUT8|nr:uncharacterized protein NEUTE1DRAFT_71737 [Neurospora tetrasperma FGSC 2508]EGO52299.1 hypothetical protein NEUTE1DRAFT_71737 [Neurospora tetrasperma FGSC 2508]
MTSTTTTATSTTYTTTPKPRLGLSKPARTGRGLSGIATASTPNLNQLYSSQAPSLSSSRLVPPALSRKASYAALTQNSLATIPDDTEAYALHSVLNTTDNDAMPLSINPGTMSTGDEITIGDMVEVPGNMTGTVRFIGSVDGRKGIFAGVELHREFASRGKNSGDVDGVSYFNTSLPGAGIFLPLSKAVKRDAGSGSLPRTPTDLVPPGPALKLGGRAPATPSIRKFSQSVGPGAVRPESPMRRLQMTPGSRTSLATPGPPGRFPSPQPNKFSQSVRGVPGDTGKRLPSHTRKGSVGPRSISSLGNAHQPNFDDEDAASVSGHNNGGVTAGSIPGMRFRAPSRAASRLGNAHEEELEKLRTQLEDRERQLRDQAATLVEMESSLTELQALIESSEGSLRDRSRQEEFEDKDVAQLRALLQEKNDKIALLTAEFDAHRADFRSTIDTLELASSETERIYEKKIEELMQENQELRERTEDVDAVAIQLKQLEELVQELEEGLEDARRGEAEARGEVEFLRGEVERTRTELRREREKAQAAINGANGSPDSGPLAKELEQKEDEIRGLKAIIHSLSRDSAPGDDDDDDAMTPTAKTGESIEDRLAREKLEREVAELHAMLDSKASREEELEREIEMLRRGNAVSESNHRSSTMTVGSNNERSSQRESRSIVVPVPQTTDKALRSRGSTLEAMPESDSYSAATDNGALWCELCDTSGHDILSCTNMFGSANATENATHKQQQSKSQSLASDLEDDDEEADEDKDDIVSAVGSMAISTKDDDIKPAPLSPTRARTQPLTPQPAAAEPTSRSTTPLEPIPTDPIVPSVTVAKAAPLPNLMESGPVAGKESGVVDASKWCALCERDGHDSVDCPFEDEF